MSEANVNAGTSSAREDNPNIDPNSYIATRLQHASPEHLHVTSRRFFIGPIPEGWLNSNRKAWYKRRLELTNYSSREATFTAAQQQDIHHRTHSGLRQPSIAARMQFSFPQPEDVFDEGEASDHGVNDDAAGTEEDTDEEVETTALAPVSTADAKVVNQAEADRSGDRARSSTGDGDMGRPAIGTERVDSWKTAREDQTDAPKTPLAQIESQTGYEEDGNNRRSTSTRGVGGAMDAAADNMDSSSRTALLRAESPVLPLREGRSADNNLMKHTPTPVQTADSPDKGTRKALGVRFKVAEGVVNQQRRIGKRVGSARSRVANRMARRNTLKEGTVVKMERMLVRMDVTTQQLPDGFDENESLRTESTQLEKWTEFMVVVRKSYKQDEDDFRLQFYKSRAIPEIESESTKKKPAREVKLLPKTTHVNLFSSLDKTVVVWHPYRKGFRIVILRPVSASNSVEWYTFLRDILGWNRPSTLQINVPDLDVTLHLDRPFQTLEEAGVGAEDEATALYQTVEAERAVASKIVRQSMDMLRKDPEWTQVLDKWTESANMGLAWKRYDRLEWVYGANEQKMYGSMAMQHSYDLELRPKHHYPTATPATKSELLEEPAPIEGFLVRLTSQRGTHQRLGKAFFKRLYFATHDHFLFFNRPAKSTPPHPPRLASISGKNVPSSAEIVKKTPMMFDVEPFKVEGGQLEWLKPGLRGALHQHESEAKDENRRNVANIIASDGIINMCQIVKVRQIQRGASEADRNLDSGSDVDFHADVENTTREDGTTTGIDDERIFELVLKNQLVIRLQAYSKETRDEWIRRLRQLVRYWKARTTADINTYKVTRQANLTSLNIDEDMEARLGQFAHKWEVSRSEASPDLFNLCRLVSCRNITMSGMLYRKTRKHSTFYRCEVILTGGQMTIYKESARKATGEQIPHIHQEKQQVIDLRECYVYSGLIVEEDLLYANRTFDANNAGMLGATPRIYLDDNWSSADVDVMTCFVLWTNRRKTWFRSVVSDGGDASTQSGSAAKTGAKGSTRSQLRRVTQLGVPGRGMVFKCRSRAERDLWVLSVAAEIENAIEREAQDPNATNVGLVDARLEH